MTVNNVSGPRYPGGVIMYANDQVYDKETKKYKQNDLKSITAIEFKGEESYKLAYKVMHGTDPDTTSPVFNAFKKEMNKAADRANDANEGKVTTLSYGDVLILSQHAKTKAEVQQEIDAVEAAEKAKQDKLDDIEKRKEQLAEDKLANEKRQNTIEAVAIGAPVGAIAGVTATACVAKTAMLLGISKATGVFVAASSSGTAFLGPWGWAATAVVSLAIGGYVAYQYLAKPENQNLEEEHLIEQEEAALNEDNK